MLLGLCQITHAQRFSLTACKFVLTLANSHICNHTVTLVALQTGMLTVCQFTSSFCNNTVKLKNMAGTTPCVYLIATSFRPHLL